MRTFKKYVVPMCKKAAVLVIDFLKFFMLVNVLPAEVLNLPPGLGDDLGLVGVHRHAHQALQRPVTPSLHPVNKKSYFWIFPVLYSTLLHLPPIRSTVSEDAEIEPRNSCDFGIGCQTL